jgi:DNA polymerase-3 subunit epsilon
MDSRVLVAHNASLDLRFLLAEFQRCGYGNDSPNALDITTLSTMELAHRYVPGAAGMSLAECCAAYGIEVGARHHAQADALA